MASIGQPAERVAAPAVDRLEWVALASLTVALAVGAAAAMRAGWTPISDDALIELRVRDVPGDLPLVGVYSRYGWSHPGPLQLWLLAVPYRVLGGVSAALVVGAMFMHLVAILGAWWLARRLDRIAGWVVLIALVATLATWSPELVRTPWNPYVALVGAGTLVIAGWSTARRSIAGLIAMVVVASLLVQAHVVTAPYVLAVAGTATVLALWVPWNEEREPIRWRGVALAAGVGVLVWIPPLVDQLRGDPGNLSRFIEQRGGDEAAAGVGTAVRVATQAFAWFPGGTGQGAAESFVNEAWAVPVWLLVPVAGLVVALRARSWLFVVGSLVGAAGLVGSMVATAMLTDAPYSYLVVGHRSLAAAWVAVGAASMLSLAPPTVRRHVGPVAAAVVVALSLVVLVRQVGAGNPYRSYEPTVSTLTAAATAAVPEPGPVALVAPRDFRASEVGFAVMLQLERGGYDVFGVDVGSAKIGGSRVTEAASMTEITVAPLGAAHDLQRDGWRVIERHDPLDGATRDQIDALIEERTQVTASLESIEDDDERFEQQVRVLQLNERIAEAEDGAVPMLIAVRER